ncbi:glycine--tRNA ligase [archaeon BMS3Abin17]|nr:glycine--tRNA ligase [archaeon BMS3Abin17]HDZ60323.1 glycine--tRNA ligase [Candidatus Pacearchaeota archaeon]
MAFIVKSKVYGKDYYYLRKSKREGNKVKSICLGYLGKTRKEAEKKAKVLLERIENKGIDHKEGKKEVRVLKHEKISIEDLANFCKRKGFVFRSSDIYGGFAGFWDFGPLGVELFNNLKNDWWNFFVQQKENMIGIESSIISHPKVWEASGHIDNFNVNDYLVTCLKCKKSTKVDKPDLEKIKCDCGGEYDWSKAQMVEQMFRTRVGSNKEEAFLRGETAQGIFTDFKLIQQTSRMRLPFGVAQIGRCFRNEIAPRDFLFRSREFHIGEFEFFIHPKETKCNLLEKKHLNVKFRFLDSETQKKASEELKEVKIKELLDKNKLEEWHAYWLAEQIIWFKNLGLNEIKIREHTKDELSHYSSATFDIDYEYPFGSKEVAGNANRGQFDLTQHQKASKESMEVFDENTKEKILPRVIEPTFGIERVFLALLTKTYTKNQKGEVVLRLPARLAPIKAAVFPIVKQLEFEKIAEQVVNDLKKEWNVIYDKSGSIGRRYARNDEIGTPFCITIDADSPRKKDVTIRERDSGEQVRVKLDKLKEILKKAIEGEDILKLGKLVNTRKK